MNNSSNGSITKEVISFVTGNLANDFIDHLKRKIEGSKPVQRIREIFDRDRVHSDTKRILELSFADTFRILEPLSEKSFKDFFNDPQNKRIIFDWILNEITEDSFDVGRFNIESYIEESKTNKVFEEVLNQLFESIKNRKRREFSPETVNIISLIKGQFHELRECIYGVSASVNANFESFEIKMREVVRQELSQQQQQFHTSIAESSHSTNYTKEIELIKSLLDKGKIITTRNKAFELKELSEKNNLGDAETNFLINAYIAETFVMSEGEEKEAIPYLENAAQFVPSEERGFRSLALANLFKGDYERGLEYIDKALNLKPNKAEAINIKAQLLLQINNVAASEQLLDESTIINSSKPDHLWITRGVVKAKCGKYDEAIAAYQEASKTDGTNPDLSVLKAEAVITKLIAGTNHDDFFKLSEHYGMIVDVEKELTSALEKLDQERKKTIGLVYHQRSIVNLWLGKHTESKSDSHEAIRCSFDTIEVRRCLVTALIKLEKWNEVLGQIPRMKELGLSENDAIVAESEMNLALRRPDIAIQILLKRIDIDKPARPEDLDFWILLADAYDKNYETSQADKVLSHLDNLHKNDYRVQLAIVKHLKRLGETSKAKEILEKILGSIEGSFRLIAMAMLADTLYEENLPESYHRAAELYSQLVDTYRIDFTLKRYAVTLYKAGRLLQCFRVCDEVIQKNGFVELFAELKAAILFNTNNFRGAATLLKQLANNNPNKAEYLVNYGICLFHLGERNNAYEAVRQAERFVAQKPEHLAFMSAAYHAVGRIQKSIDLAYQALDQDFKNPDLHKHYISLFLMSNIVPESIDKKYILRYQDCMNNFNERFPGHVYFEKLKIPNDINQFKEELLKRLSQDSKRREKIESYYQTNKLPLSLLAKAVGRDLITTWGAVATHPFLKIWTSSGNRDELKEESEIATTARTIMIDPLTVLTLKSLDLLNDLGRLFEKVYVIQSTIDMISERIDFEKLGVSEGQKVIYEHNGELLKFEISAQEISKRIDYLQDILSTFKGNPCFEVVGISLETVESNLKVRFSEIDKGIGKETAQSIFEANTRKIPLYAEDFRIRQLARNEFGTEGFGSQALLPAMLRANIIDKKRYHLALAKLLVINYRFISIDGETLKTCVEDSSFLRTPRALEPFESLRDPSNEIPPLINIATAFLDWLWNENIPIENKNNWTDVILNVVTDERVGMRTGIVLIIKRNLESRFRIQLKEQFEKALDTWDKAYHKTLIRML